MAWTTLLDSIKSYIKQNRNQEITGTVLQNVLVNMVNQLGANMTYAGLATPTTNPGVPNGPTFYIAVSAGTYTNFNGITVAKNEIALLNFYNDTWSKDTLMAMTGVGQPGTGEGAEVFNDYGANTAAGTFSHAEGEDTAASGCTEAVSAISDVASDCAEAVSAFSAALSGRASASVAAGVCPVCPAGSCEQAQSMAASRQAVNVRARFFFFSIFTFIIMISSFGSVPVSCF